MHLYRGFLLHNVSGIVLLHSISAPRPVNAQQGQRLVEISRHSPAIDVSEKDDILYYVQTRREILSTNNSPARPTEQFWPLGFFDKTPRVF